MHSLLFQLKYYLIGEVTYPMFAESSSDGIVDHLKFFRISLSLYLTDQNTYAIFSNVFRLMFCDFRYVFHSKKIGVCGPCPSVQAASSIE